MKKTELINSISEKTGLSKTECTKVVDATFDTITQALAEGDSVTFIGFGTFKVGQRAERDGRNPKTGDVIKIPAAQVPQFKAGKTLKERVNTPS